MSQKFYAIIMFRYNIKREILQISTKKNKKIYDIPDLLDKYINEDTISICIKVNNNNFEFVKKNNNIDVNIDCCRIIDDFGFNFYMEYYGEKVDLQYMQKLSLFEGYQINYN